MTTKARVLESEYRAFPVWGTRELPGENAAVATLGTVLFQAIKPWTIDHLRLSYDRIAYGGGSTPTVQFYKFPADVTIDEFLASGSSKVVALTGEVPVNTAPKQMRDLFEGSVLNESDRRFESGDRLVCIQRGFSTAATQGSGPGSGVSPSGEGAEIGFENAVVSWLGRTRRL